MFKKRVQKALLLCIIFVHLLHGMCILDMGIDCTFNVGYNPSRNDPVNTDTWEDET